MSAATTEPVRELLHPCPFCGGPPSPCIVKAIYPGGWLNLEEVDTQEGTEAEAFVHCHECGARSERVEDLVYDAETYNELLAMGVRKWQDRDTRHGDLYRSSVLGRRAYFPRPEETT